MGENVNGSAHTCNIEGDGQKNEVCKTGYKYSPQIDEEPLPAKISNVVS